MSEFGTVALTQTMRETDPPTYELFVNETDPRVLVSESLLDLLFARQVASNHAVRHDEVYPAWERNATLDWETLGVDDEPDYMDAILRIHGTNRTVVYRITGRWGDDQWVAEWPD